VPIEGKINNVICFYIPQQLTVKTTGGPALKACCISDSQSEELR
jgi:hypothetical protein